MTPALFRISIIGLISLYCTACGVYRESSLPPASPDERVPIMTVGTGEAALNVQEKLFTAHTNWQGTPYVMGGSSIRGVDCSAFIQIIYRDYFQLGIPRHTREQLRLGAPVRRNHISPGDLIFFRTGKDTLHVGIAMDNGDFLHASVSSGVMISNISENYWATRYLGARRVLN